MTKMLMIQLLLMLLVGLTSFGEAAVAEDSAVDDYGADDGAEEDYAAEDGDGDEDAPVEETDTLPINVPCQSFFNIELVSPCGEVELGKEGVDISTPFGTYHIPGTQEFVPEVKVFKQAFSRYTFYVVIAITVGFILWTVLHPKRRAHCIAALKRAAEGHIVIPIGEEYSGDEDEDYDSEDYSDDELTEEEQQRELANRMDPYSEDFIAPGNIYRLCAVLHPGKVGWRLYMQWALKAAVCAWMQISIPVFIIHDIFSQWEFYYVKSPIWFVSHGPSFASMFAALGSLCAIFQGRCANNIMAGAIANKYILTHKDPSDPGPVGYTAARTAESSPLLTDQEDENRATRSFLGCGLPGLLGCGGESSRKAEAAPAPREAPRAEEDFDAESGQPFADTRGSRDEVEEQPAAPAAVGVVNNISAGVSGAVAKTLKKAQPKQPRPKMSESWVYKNEVFWCSLSMIMNVSMSLILQIAMFMKVATFKGDVSEVALVAVSLYFVFDLDKKIMESDEELTLRYRRAVIKQTALRPEKQKPPAIFRMATAAIWFSSQMTTIGLISIVLFAWKNNDTGVIIGGDPFDHLRV